MLLQHILFRPFNTRHPWRWLQDERRHLEPQEAAAPISGCSCPPTRPLLRLPRSTGAGRRARRGVDAHQQLQAMYVPLLASSPHTSCPRTKSDTQTSTGRPLSIQPQCVSIRWRCLSPSSAPPPALLPPSELRIVACLHVPPLHRGRFTRRKCLDQDCRVWRSWIRCALYISEEREEVERHRGCCTVGVAAPE